MPASENLMLRAALAYAHHDRDVFPCHPKGKIPLTEHGLKDATRDPAIIQAWWARWPDANIGVAMGSGLFALDIDVTNGTDGYKTLAHLESMRGPLPVTPRQHTPSGGAHLLFKLPEGVVIPNSAGKLGPGLDTRGAGGYIVVAPSLGPDGKRYRWEPAAKLGAVEIATAPQWLIEALTKPKRAEPCGNGAASELPHEAYVRAAIEGELGRLVMAREGERNHALNTAAFNLGQFVGAKVLDEGWLRAELARIGLQIGLDSAEVERTVESGITAGMKEPRRIPEPAHHRSVAAAPRESTVTTPNPQVSAPREAAWPTMDDSAYHGLPGDVVRAIGPHTEADPAAILIQFLAAFGNAIGRGPYYQVEGDYHRANLFAVLVGETAKGRKGTSWGRVRQVFDRVERPWTERCVHSGLSSGEGVIWAVRDPIIERVREGKGANAQYVETERDPGVADKRLFIIEPEFSGVLRVMQREGNTLSRVLRDAWDRGDLASLTKNSPARATGALLSVIGHITIYELRQVLDKVDIANGFFNRFLPLCVRRARCLPHGGQVDDVDIEELAKRTREAIEHARQLGRVGMDNAATRQWEAVYPDLSEGRPGLLGAVLARAEAQVVRLAMIYALLDGQHLIGAAHLRAALALWEYVEASAVYIFGDALGDPVADEIMRALTAAGPAGMTRTAIRDLFGRHRSAGQIGASLAMLAQLGRIETRPTRDTGGRPAEIWVAKGCM